MRRVCVVLDAAGFFAGYASTAPDRVYAPPSVLAEVRDQRSKQITAYAISGGKVVVVEPEQGDVEHVRKIAAATGDLGRLSPTDIDILAVTRKLLREGCRVIIVTDDRAVQNVALHMGAEVEGVKRSPMRRARKYVYICPACNYRSDEPGTCPVCGTELRRVRG